MFVVSTSLELEKEEEDINGGCIHAEEATAWAVCLYDTTSGDNNGEYRVVALDSLL